MKVTRDVIYDLLPGYFSGDVSADTRAIVDEFLRDDPEFRQMMERFREVFREPRSSAAAVASDTATFERARHWLQKRSELRGYVIAFGFAALCVVVLALVRLEPSGRSGPWVIAMAFLATSLIAWFQLYRLKRAR
jgi:anti-sigma factor RsiW